MIHEKVQLTSKEADGYVISLGPFNLVSVNTDVGMVGGYESVIGLNKDQAIQRFLTSRPQRFEPGKLGLVFSSVFIEVNTRTGKAISIQREMVVEDVKEDESH